MILRRVERIVFQQDKAIAHELSFSVDRTEGSDGATRIPLLYLPKRTLFQLDLRCDGEPLVIPSRDDSADRTGDTLVALVRKRHRGLLGGGREEFRQTIVDMVKAPFDTRETTWLDQLVEGNNTEASRIIGELSREDKEVWRIIELLASHRLLFVELPATTLDTQVVKFRYTEYLDVTTASTWFEEPMVSYFRERRRLRPFTGRAHRFLAPLFWTRTGIIARTARTFVLQYFAFEVVPVTLLPFSEPQSFRLELEAPNGVDIDGLEIAHGDRRNPLLPAHPANPLAYRYRHSTERIPSHVGPPTFRDPDAPDPDEERGALAHLHIGNSKLAEVGLPGPATALIELRTSRDGPIRTLRRLALANFVLALFGAVAMRRLLLLEADAAIALLLVASASVTVLISRSAGEHGLASILLSEARRSTFWSTVIVYAIAAAIVVAGEPDSAHGEYTTPSYAVQWFAWIAAAVNLARATGMVVRSALSTMPPLQRRRRHLVRNAAFGVATVAATLAFAYLALAPAGIEVDGGELFVASHPRSAGPPVAPGEADSTASDEEGDDDDASDRVRVRQATEPRSRIQFEPNQRLTVGVALRNDNGIRALITNVALSTHGLGHGQVAYSATVAGPPGPEPLQLFRPFRLEGSTRRSRYVEIDVFLGPCAPRVAGVVIDEVSLAVRRWEVPRFRGQVIRLRTPLEVVIPRDTWCEDE